MALVRKGSAASTKTKVVVVPEKKKVPKSEYSFDIDTDGARDAHDLSSSNFSGKVSKASSSFSFTFYIDDVACCGIKEVQNFRIDRNSTSIPRDQKVALVKKMFQKLSEIATESNGECRTLFLTTIDNEACRLVDEALSDGELFTKVKTFVNSNTHRANDLYISNN